MSNNISIFVKALNFNWDGKDVKILFLWPYLIGRADIM